MHVQTSRIKQLSDERPLCMCTIKVLVCIRFLQIFHSSFVVGLFFIYIFLLLENAFQVPDAKNRTIEKNSSLVVGRTCY